MARYYGGHYRNYAPYVSVAERRRQAAKTVSVLQKKGKSVNPVHIAGRAIARTFWGKAWCDNLESYSDFSNRLPRGRTYVRNGSVIDLQVGTGEIVALVSGSSVYTVKIKIHALEKERWKALIRHCSGQIDSLVELLQGKFSRGVMEVITCRERGLFPSPRQIAMTCSCPDSAVMCKHVAAVLYGVGARLDERPELFFQLRNVDHAELITAASAATPGTRPPKSSRVLRSGDLSGIFGIDLDASSGQDAPPERGSLDPAGSKAASRDSPARRGSQERARPAIAPKKRRRS